MKKNIFRVIGLFGLCTPLMAGTLSYLDDTSTLRTSANTTIELRSPTTGSVEFTTETASDGSFTLTPIASNTYDVYVVAKNTRFEFGVSLDNRVAPVTVYDMYQSHEGQKLGSAINADITISSNAWAFHTLQILEKGYSATATYGKYPERMTRLIYPKNSTSFIKGDRAMQLSSDQLWKDDVLLHEWMHLIAYTNSQTDSSGGLHYTTGHYDLRMAWNEGMANYASCAFRNDPNILGLNIETMSTSTFQRSTNEMAVANVLWRAGKTYGHEKVFNIIWEFKTLLSEFDENSNLDFFHDRWNVHNAGDDLQTIYDERSMSYKADSVSGNIEASPYVVSDPRSTVIRGLTWYPKGDMDFFEVPVESGITYVFMASNMQNGGLPKLDLMRGGVIIDTKTYDDATLEDVTSTITHTATSSENLILRTSRFNSTTEYVGLGISRNHYPMTTGYYGGYDLRFTSNAPVPVTSPIENVPAIVTPSPEAESTPVVAETSTTTVENRVEEAVTESVVPSSSGGGGGGGCLLH